ncbi:MAG: protein translocase subunit SecD [Ardenticatenales bacterium]|nr:protein translocase subunit SecD [Ardenticatenales bacterium]
MERQTILSLLGISLLALAAIFIAMPHQEDGIHVGTNVYPVTYHRGLDLQGGLRVLLEADLQPGQSVDDDQMEAALTIIERRVNGLGVSEPLVQRVGDRRILVELPGVENPDQAVAAFGNTGLLEFVDAGSTPLEPGQRVNTSQQTPEQQDPSLPTFETILTGADLKPGSAVVQYDQQTNQPIIGFAFKDGAPADKLREYTRQNIGSFMAITVDKEVISAPVIQSEIPGEGIIQGSFTIEEAEAIVLQLKYGALPVPLKVIENRTVGATLGTDSVQKSLIAGGIGLAAVALFMVLYYRLPGVLAVLALIIYTALTLSLFKLVPVTLTLAGIAGFLLSVGMAVDANILIFERMKEELRAGKSLRGAMRAGFDRAWPSIRDSNASTLITCAILFLFGANFGASIVQGFALTLALGVLVSLFTAITITRTFLLAVMQSASVENRWWFGV